MDRSDGGRHERRQSESLPVPPARTWPRRVHEHGRAAAAPGRLPPASACPNRPPRAPPRTRSPSSRRSAIVEAFEAMSEVTPGVVVGDVAEDGTDHRHRARARGQARRTSGGQRFVLSLKSAQRLVPPARRPPITDDPRAARATCRRDRHGGARRRGRDRRHRLRLRPPELPATERRYPAAASCGTRTAPARVQAGFDYGDRPLRPTPSTRRSATRPIPYGALGYGPDPGRARPRHPRHGHRGRQRPRAPASREWRPRRTSSSWTSPTATSRGAGRRWSGATSATRSSCWRRWPSSSSGAGTDAVRRQRQPGHQRRAARRDRPWWSRASTACCTQAPNRARVHRRLQLLRRRHPRRRRRSRRRASFDLAWLMAPGDRTQNELELWYAGRGRAERGADRARRPERRHRSSPARAARCHRAGQVVLFAANRLDDPNNGDNMIGVFLSPAASPAGRWVLRLTAPPGDAGAVPRLDRARRQRPVDVRGAARQHPHDRVDLLRARRRSWSAPTTPTSRRRRSRGSPAPAPPATAGRSRRSRAPGHNVLAAASPTEDGTTRMSGTSMAEPGGDRLRRPAARRGRPPAATARRRRDQGRRGIELPFRSSARGGPGDDRYGAGRVSLASRMLDRLPGP